MNVVPLPGAWSTTSMRPPSVAISERTTSMPTPRPEIWVTCDAVEKPGLEDELDELARRSAAASGAMRPLRDRLARTISQVEAARRRRRARWRFRCRPGARSARSRRSRTCRRARRSLARLDAVVQRVAQQVLERPDELFQHRAVELGLAAADLEIGALVEFLRDLAAGSGTAARTGCRTGTVRIANSCCCSSRDSRACASSAASASSRLLAAATAGPSTRR